MGATRRDFLSTASGAIAGAMCSGPLTVTQARASGGSSSALRKRKDVATLTPSSPDIIALSKGVAAMKKLPAADLRNWRKQAEIHGQVLGGDFNHCQHGNWWFTSWHRAYLYYFEAIIRKLGEYDEFALPYWDWSKDFSLPALFWGAGNPLDNPSRQGEAGSGRRIGKADVISKQDQQQFVNLTVISRILRPNDFEVFGGDQVANLGDSAAAGSLEGTPHNFIHRWVGGDMVTAGSPYDPIFWLHHCNVDRLWSEWVRKHPGGMPDATCRAICP